MIWNILTALTPNLFVTVYINTLYIYSFPPRQYEVAPCEQPPVRRSQADIRAGDSLADACRAATAMGPSTVILTVSTRVDTRSGSFSSNTQYLTARCCSSYQHPSLLLNGLSFNKELSKDLLKKGEITMSISSTALICGDWKTSMKMRMEILGREDLQMRKVEETTMSISSTALTCGD